jgi:ornithine cyclodeaminase
MMRFIKETEVPGLLPIQTAIDCVERAFRDRALGDAYDTPRERTKTPLGHLHVLQGASMPLNLIGFKAYFPGKTARTFLVHLINLRQGNLEAIIEADEMGILRTGGATGVATRALSRQEASVLACFGSGRHALTQLRSVCAVRSIQEVRIHGRSQERLEAFRARILGEHPHVRVRIAGTPAEALQGADIVNIVTRAEQPVFNGRELPRGVHINAVGSNALNRREIDLATLQAADVIVVDSTDVAQRECGDLLSAVETGLIHWRNVPDLGDVLIGRHPGRASAEQITLFESQGMGLQDLYVGHHVWQEALRREVGADLPM